MTEVTVLHAFAQTGAEGFESQGALLLASDDALYGTTLHGGMHGQGVIFMLSLEAKPGVKAFQVLHHFSLEKSNGRSPGSPLAEGKEGALYGTTSLGGPSGLGTVFRINKDGKGFTILRNFTGVGADGRVPFAGIRQTKDGAWLGTTDEGGQFGYGTIYRINSDGTGYRVLHHFGGRFRSDGEKPHAALCEAGDGRWYGVTAAGGREGHGTIFAIMPDGSGYRLLAAFTGAPQDGAKPFGNLIEGTDGRLYGTTVAGGRGSQGTLFRMERKGGITLLQSFSGLGGEGRNPHAGLLQARDGRYYGVTLAGGPDGGGVVFQLASDGTGCRVLHSFAEGDAAGRGPYAGLTPGRDGSLYGTTSGGSQARSGTIFRLRPAPVQ